MVSVAEDQDPQELVPIGSKWFSSGAHCEIIGHTVRDGEPAVRFRWAGTRRTMYIITRLFLRCSTRTD